LFESAHDAGPEFIDGTTLGRVLAATGVQLFSMNACRSGDSAGTDRQRRAQEEAASGQPSIVEEVIGEGVPACIGMRREVYPGTPTRFFPAFYPEFLRGSSPGEAARTARARLRAEPLTAGTFREDSAPIDDWSIPVIGERAVIRLSKHEPDNDRDPAESVPDPIPAHLLEPPLVGFDGAVLLLESLLTRASVVLVHGPVFSGKSRLAIEYARWLSETSPTPRPAHYVRLSSSSAAEEIALRISGQAGAEGTRCADLLRDRGALLILDQADLIGPATQAFLSDLLARLDGACPVLVTARAHDLSWLPAHQRIGPDILDATGRAELAKRWSKRLGVHYDTRKFQALEFFCGGYPGVLILLLSASHELIDRGEATASDISSWLSECAGTEVARLAEVPGLGPAALSVETLIDQLASDLPSLCAELELPIVPFIARFNVCCDAATVARLATAATGTEVPDEVAGLAMDRLVNAGLALDTGPAQLGVMLHPLLKLVASRLPAAAPGLDLDAAMIDTVARMSADLAARFREDTVAVVWAFMLHKQNLSEALGLALDRRRFEAVAHLVDGLSLYCRYEGDVDFASRYLDEVLPLFIDPRTGTLHPERREAGRRVWDHAMWVAPDWPRAKGPRRNGTVRLLPSSDDHYAEGLFWRAVGRYDKAYAAFLAELGEPASDPRYSPGDLEWFLAQIQAGIPDNASIAVQASRISYLCRRPKDAIGRASSLTLEAEIRIAMALSREEYKFNDEDVTERVELRPEDLAALDMAADVLRAAQSEVGGLSAENRYAAGILWTEIMLARGDLTSAVSYFEESATIMMSLQTTDIVGFSWNFARNLIRHGWTARGYEVANAAFHHAMRTGDVMLPTRIRKFCERLRSRYPELDT
jgi:hypothetical protein